MLDLSKILDSIDSAPATVLGQTVTVRLVPAVVMTMLREALPCPPAKYLEVGGALVPAGDEADEARRRADTVRFNLLEVAAAMGQAFECVLEYPAGWGAKDVAARRTTETLKAEDCLDDLVKARAWVRACLGPKGLGAVPDARLRPVRDALRALEKGVEEAAGKA